MKTSDDYIYGQNTPYGEFSAGIVTEVAEKMEPGTAYYLDIFPAE